MKNTTINKMTKIALITAIICIIAPFSIPIGVVPISFTNFILLLSLYLLSTKESLISYAIYLLIGLIGIPVFSGFTSGPSKLFGPTGGYLIGFIFLILISGICVNKFPNKSILCFFSMIIGSIVVYLFGSLWLAYQAKLTLLAAVATGVLPFVLGDLIKIILVLLIGPILKKQIGRFNTNI